VEGFFAARGIWMCVMDADLQHPPEMIPRLMSHALQSASDLVIGSRFADGASTPGLDSMRSAISHAFITSARLLFINQLRWVTDPLTGFFLVRRDQVDLEQLHPNGFKILIEMIVQFPHLKISELGFVMEPRYAGSSKASVHEAIRYYRKLMELRFTRGNPRFARFAAVGLSGIIVNTLALAMFTEIFHIYYLVSAVLATQLSTLWNFLLTEFWVFADRRGTGSIGVRMIGFFVLNNALLVVRGPTLSLLVQHLGMNYIIANLISIAIATVVRYLVADRLLWAQGKRSEPRTAYAKAMPLAGDVHHATD
jgi:dolichol-phosphate mannosyltransferase